MDSFPLGPKGQHLLAALNLQALPKREQDSDPMPPQPNPSMAGVFCHHWVMSSLLQHAGPASSALDMRNTKKT